ncbi:hypothetical protein CLV28_0685 [Sediminihabitans luteus]|uniref:Uncharacterized protein n=1 Tax=Sediminihabitans luteus TaxID=1138585 RepID=A0A2M9CZU3_9CELL|nr:hypothetical protein [Sediminihabitans luteus]PJJ77466.1 hypothetical protein CLV28_0685 [Sediminihabitans luteus]GII98360.1 hypothetical protein Slu03_07380 [Sediminihabitans luteus]
MSHGPEDFDALEAKGNATTEDVAAMFFAATEHGHVRAVRVPRYAGRAGMSQAAVLDVATRALCTGTRPSDVMSEAESPYGWPVQNSIVQLDMDEQEAIAACQERSVATVRRERARIRLEEAAFAWADAENHHPSQILARTAETAAALRAAITELREAEGR